MSEVNRRGFLAGAAAGVATVGSTRLRGESKNAGANERVRVGVVGAAGARVCVPGCHVHGSCARPRHGVFPQACSPTLMWLAAMDMVSVLLVWTSLRLLFCHHSRWCCVLCV